MAVTFPCTGVTVAIVVLLELYWTDLSEASLGTTVADSVSFAPTSRVNVGLFSVTPDGATLLGCKRRRLLSSHCRKRSRRNSPNL